MKSNWKIFIFVGLLLIFLVCAGLFSYFSGRIPSNDISVTGNTAGNLNNGGGFAESEGVVYFSNAYDNGCMYSMNVDETNLKKLSTSSVSSINVGGNYLYYYMDSTGGGTGLGYVVRTYGVYRSKLDGEHTQCLDRQAAVTMQLVGDYVYYQRYNNTTYTQLYKVKTDKSENVLISEDIINPAACHNGIIYYNGTGRDHYLYALDTRTDTPYTVYQGDLWYPVYHNDYIYYMDVSSNYRICRYSLSAGTVEILTNDRVDFFNVGDQYIYYQKNSQTEPALMRMRLDGSNPEVVADGIYQNLQLTSSYAYFNVYGSPFPVYHTPVNGPVSVTEFTAARDNIPAKK